jgi:serine/threonine protein kinase
MTVPIDGTEADDALVAEFLRQMEAAEDRAAVLRRWCETHPRLADDLAELAASAGILSRMNGRPPPPERLGDFRIVGEIAHGGMGVVYLAVQEPFRRRVAVKALHPLHYSEEARTRFLREQEVLAQLHHTHIVPIFAAGQVGSTQYFAMPFIEGESLNKTIQDLTEKGRGLGVAHFHVVAGRVADAAEAIHHAHQKGVVHRDLKPANLMTDDAGHIWVLDFGLVGYLAECGTIPTEEGTPPPP